MKKILIIFLMVLLPLFLYSQTYQFNIIDEFALKSMNISYLGYDNNKIMIYDSINKKVYSYDTLGACLDSLAINKYKINGLDFYEDTLFILNNKVNSKKATIFKINYQNGEIYDSLVWAMGNETDYSEFLAVNKNSFVSYISAGWSSSLVQISQNGKTINSINSPGLGTPAGITCYNNKFYFISSLEANEKGNYYEYKINKDEIQNIYTDSIPIYYPRGIACINENSFFVYSNSKKKLYRISIKQSTNQIDLHDNSSDDIIIYPNPTRKILNIKSTFPIQRIDILSIDGKIINSIFYPMNSINIDKYKKGYYILLFYSENQNIYKNLIIN